MTPAGAGAWRRRRFQPDQRTTIIVVVAVVLIAALIISHRITRFEIIYFLVLIPSIILHEISHGVVALAFGDTTAKRAGRINLNPVRHVDPVGTLLVPAILTLSGVGAYGWAKPVPVNPGNLRSPRNHIVLVALVGPLTNFALAALMSVLFVTSSPLIVREFVHATGALPPTLLQQILYLAAIANIVLGLFNCIPCPPLDGAAVLERFIPARLLPGYYNLQPFLMFLPLILLLLFRNQWIQALNNLIQWWSGKLV